MNIYCLTLDLKNDPQLIEEYLLLHKSVWPEITESIKQAGIMDMRIYHYNDRLVMMMMVDETFSFEKKAKIDAGNPKVQEWESLMWKYQKQVPGSNSNEKWILMDEIYSLEVLDKEIYFREQKV